MINKLIFGFTPNMAYVLANEHVRSIVALNIINRVNSGVNDYQASIRTDLIDASSNSSPFRSA
jgi:hypothetical protein